MESVKSVRQKSQTLREFIQLKVAAYFLGRYIPSDTAELGMMVADAILGPEKP
jgi:hypothetical protein